jgi:hypothetical protein
MGFSAIYGPNGELVFGLAAGAEGERQSEAVCEANSRLIAAAPALFTALKCFLDDDRFQVSVGGNPSAVDRMLDDARKALSLSGIEK